MLAILILAAFILYLVVATLAPLTWPVGPTVTRSAGVLFAVTLFAILRDVARHKIVTIETILGAVSVYLLLGFSFASIYALIDLLVPSAFFANYPQSGTSDYLFFSYTTLTTVGYGDLVPGTNIGRTFATLEALLGQIYLVIIVARLVSLWGRERPSVDSDPRPDDLQPTE